MKKSRSGMPMPNGLAKGLSTSKSFVGNLAKSFSAQGYSNLEDGLDDPLVRPQSNNSLDKSFHSPSSRFFTDDEVMARPTLAAVTGFLAFIVSSVAQCCLYPIQSRLAYIKARSKPSADKDHEDFVRSQAENEGS